VKKSVYTFGLLASSLVMLAVVPFLNNNNSFFTTTVMAQECDNYYGDDNSYSKYPTDNKKYECRTGPFEGFFVSSVEFCKHVKFDDRRDHSRDNKQVHKVHLDQKVILVLLEQPVHKEFCNIWRFSLFTQDIF